MTIDDLINVVDELDISYNEWIYLPKISHIVLSEDSVLYPDDYHQYYFDNTNSLLYRRYAETASNGVLKTGTVQLIVDYACILGFKQAEIVPVNKRVGDYK